MSIHDPFPKQAAYIAHRLMWCESFRRAEVEDFCARKQIDPLTGKRLPEAEVDLDDE